MLGGSIKFDSNQFKNDIVLRFFLKKIKSGFTQILTKLTE
jgi:hypothetical protein